jgi:hypothetical protein
MPAPVRAALLLLATLARAQDVQASIAPTGELGTEPDAAALGAQYW